MAASGVDAAKHDLITKNQLADQFRASDLQRTVSAGNAGEDINPVQSERIQQTKFQLGNTAGIEDQLHRSNFTLDFVCRDLTPIHIMAADAI